MGDICVRPVDPIEYPQWDQFVSSSRQGTVFHRTSWVSAIADAMNLRCSIQGCFSGDQLIGGYVLYHSRIRGVFRAGRSTAPMSNFGGLIFDSEGASTLHKREEKIRAVVDAVTGTLQNDGLDYIRLQLSPGFDDIRPFIWNRWGHAIRYTYTVSPELATPSKQARRHIRRAEDAGIVVEPSTDIESYYTLFAQTFIRQGLIPPITREQMERIYRAIRESGMGEIWVARMPSGEWAAAEINLYDEKRRYAWSAASDGTLRKNGANYLLQKKVYDSDIGREVKECYLFAANVPKLADFVSQFGPELSPYFQVWRRQGRLNLLNTPLSS